MHWPTSSSRGNAADIAEVELVEAVLAAGQGQDDRVLGQLLGELRVVVAPGLGAVAAADDEEALDRAGLDRLDDLLGHPQHGVVAAAGEDLLVRFLRDLGLLGRLDDLGEVPPLDVLHPGPLHPAPGEEAVLVGVGRALDAVGVEDDGAGEVLELLVLVLPGAAEVARQVRVLLEARVAVGGKHLDVGVDVDPLALGLLEQLLEHLQVVAGDEDRLAGRVPMLTWVGVGGW